MDDKTSEEMSIDELETLLRIKRSAVRLRRIAEALEAQHVPASHLPSEGSLVGSLPKWRSRTVRLESIELQPLTRKSLYEIATAGLQEAFSPQGRRRIRDSFLLLVEIAAVIGLIAILGYSLSSLNRLNREAAQAFETVTYPTPTEAAFLPGSFPPTPAALPPFYQSLVRPVTPVVLPTPGPQSATRIVISKIKVDAPVVEGDDWEALKKGVGHHPGSANPGERGNVVLSGHVDVFGAVFRYLDRLEVGDEVILYAGEKAYHYRVAGKRIVEPTEVSVMDPTREPTLTLITCYPYRVDTKRIVVFAELVRTP
ncbi:MAG: sortase [Chloroflexi bacterium]|nr:sortase [Chloroflexota bacterium]